MMTKTMTDLEIKALIKTKRNKIKALEKEIKALEKQIRFKNPSELTLEELEKETNPVWVVSLKSNEGFYALPIIGGVMTRKCEIYHHSDYYHTWIAYSSQLSIEENVAE